MSMQPDFQTLQGDLQAAIRAGDAREVARLKSELLNFEANHSADTRTLQERAIAERRENDERELAAARQHLTNLRRSAYVPELALKAAEVRLRNAAAACAVDP